MVCYVMGFPGGSVVKYPSANAEDLIPGLGRYPEKGNGNRLQYSCPGNPKDREAWQGNTLGVGKEMDVTERLSVHAGGTAATFHVLSS